MAYSKCVLMLPRNVRNRLVSVAFFAVLMAHIHPQCALYRELQESFDNEGNIELNYVISVCTKPMNALLRAKLEADWQAASIVTLKIVINEHTIFCMDGLDSAQSSRAPARVGPLLRPAETVIGSGPCCRPAETVIGRNHVRLTSVRPSSGRAPAADLLRPSFLSWSHKCRGAPSESGSSVCLNVRSTHSVLLHVCIRACLHERQAKKNSLHSMDEPAN